MHFKKADRFGTLLGKFVKEGFCVVDNTHLTSYNFCDFLKAIGFGLFWTFALFAVAGWFLVFGIAPWLLYFFSYFPLPWATDTSWGWNIHVASAIFGGGVVIIAILTVVAYCDAKIEAWKYARERRRNKLPPKHAPKNTWYREAYKAFKEKYCPLVTFEE